MPSIDAITFDTTGLELIDASRDMGFEKRAWRSARGDTVAIMYKPGGDHLPAAARQTPRGLLEYWARQSQERGWDHIETLLCHVGVGPAVISMTKYPQEPSGMTYMGTVAIPFQDFGYTVMIQCPEMTRLEDLLEQVVGSMRLDPAVHALPRYPLPLDPPKPGQEPTLTEFTAGRPLLPGDREPRAPGAPGPAARLEALEARRAAFPMEVLEVTAMYAVLIAGSFYIKVVAFVPVLIFFWIVVIGNKVAEHIQVRRDIDNELR